MPIYEYRCNSCQHELEKLQKLSDPPLVTCPVCHEEALRKKASAAGFRLKGGGWYETDFKSDKRKNIAGDSDSDASGSSSGKAEKPESEKAAKTDKKDSAASTTSAKSEKASSSSD